MAKVLTLPERMAIEYAVRNGLPVPRLIRQGKKKWKQTHCESYKNEYEEVIQLVLIGQWNPQEGGEYRLVVKYVDHQYDQGGTWIDHERRIELVNIIIKGPYVCGVCDEGGHEASLPLADDFLPQSLCEAVNYGKA